jgi:hypothetical protein
VGAVALLFSAAACGGAPEPPAVSDPLRSERRIAELLEPCPQGQFYDRDLSDFAPVLLEKLARGRPDPLKRAKEELGALGQAVFPLLANRFHADFADPMRSAFLENSVDALAFNPTEQAHELALEALTHPQESVRSKALDALTRWPRPADFEVVAGRLEIETKELRRKSVALLFVADPERAEDFLLGCFEREVERDLWVTAAPYMAECRSFDAARRCAGLLARSEPLLAVYLAAGAARHGESAGDALLRAELAHEDSQRRLNAVTAIQRAGVLPAYEAGLLDDPAAEMRAIAASAFASLGAPTPERRAALAGALADPSEAVRAEALRTLCVLGDAEGLARALAGLDGDSVTLQAALQALRAPMAEDPLLARKAFERLLERHALEEHRPLQQRTATFKALAQVPLAEAADFLSRIGVGAGDELLESLRAHDWLMIQAANTGLAGRTHLAGLLREELDPLRRIDLIDALGSIRDALARETLLACVEDTRAAPLERLFAAQGAIRVGPSWDVAPRLKRACYTLTAPAELEARSALQCLLWGWY